MVIVASAVDGTRQEKGEEESGVTSQRVDPPVGQLGPG